MTMQGYAGEMDMLLYNIDPTQDISQWLPFRWVKMVGVFAFRRSRVLEIPLTLKIMER